MDSLRWVLILHTFFAGGGTTTHSIPGFSEARCHQAAEMYETQASEPYTCEGQGPCVVPDHQPTAAAAFCLPGPGQP